jgi:hypothetical protein
VVLGEPAPEWNVVVDRVVDTVGSSGSQKLGPDRVGVFEQV